MPPPLVAVFGSSEPLAGEPLYEEARRVGRLLAEAGATVVTGGYGGVMEGASRGAVEAGGETLGVVAPAVFVARAPNPYLTATLEAADLHQRTRLLIERSDAYLVLFGKTGTLAELTLVWALIRAGSLAERRVVLLGAAWRRVARALTEEGMLDGKELRSTRIFEDADAAVRCVCGIGG